MNNVLSIYFYHDASVAVKIGDVYRNFEIERFTKKRYDSLMNKNKKEYESIYNAIFDIIKKKYGVTHFDLCLYNRGTKDFDKIFKNQMEYIKSLWQIKEFKSCSHHDAHASGAYYLSGFDKALVFSYDGGGWDDYQTVDFFNIYLYEGNQKKLLEKKSKDLGTFYGISAIPIKEISKKDILPSPNFLSFAGKLMGLSAYGEPVYTEQFLKLYLEKKNYSKMKLYNYLKNINVNTPVAINKLSGKVAYDFAASSQKAFEEAFIHFTKDIFKQYKGLPVCLTGGCALNVLLNERLRKMYDVPIYVSPVPNDCGVAIGMLLNQFPSHIDNITYGNWPLLDTNKLNLYIKKYNAYPINIDGICKLLNEGAIIGIAQGNSECGPRALGNRSIVCDPSFISMKDMLNEKVKFREWFRPFAPFVKEEDVNTYFDFNWKSPYMSFASLVRKEYRDEFPAITHVDNTARIQTVTEDQHELFYNLLTRYKALYNKGVLLNTSFNIKGKPILTRIDDAIEVLETTEIDYIIIEGYLFKKL